MIRKKNNTCTLCFSNICYSPSYVRYAFADLTFGMNGGSSPPVSPSVCKGIPNVRRSGTPVPVTNASLRLEPNCKTLQSNSFSTRLRNANNIWPDHTWIKNQQDQKKVGLGSRLVTFSNQKTNVPEPEQEFRQRQEFLTFGTQRQEQKRDMNQAEGEKRSNQDIRTQARPVFPFTAIVGQEEMKLALILNVIDPKIGGVMIMGDRGTGKSTTVRALVDLLPEIEVVKDDPFNSDANDLELMSQEVRERRSQNIPCSTIKKKIDMVDLPLGATEDRVCGTIDIEKALTEGVKAFEPGLLAKANRGILYVDEVNLLDDHLVDVLLDSAASGWNTVEREGISISHPARFILVGSGNPEEGELRPQLLDRFGMHAQIGTVKEPILRVKIVEQRAQFDESPSLLREQYLQSQQELAEKINQARALRNQVEMDYDLRVRVSQVCSELNVDGLRGDIVTNRASQALAAFEQRHAVTPQDIFRVIPLCLRHRLRKDPLESIDSGDKVRDVFKKIFGFQE